MMLSLLLPLADVAIAGFQYHTPHGRHCVPSGNRIQYSTATLTSRTASALGRQARYRTTADARYPITQLFNSFAVIPDSCLPAPAQHCVAQVLFIHDDRHLVAHGA